MGDVGSIVHIYRGGEAFEVEFLALDGNTAAVMTVPAPFLRPAAATDLTRARVLDDAQELKPLQTRPVSLR